MRALVLAGGTGSRMRPLTHSRPKQLIPVAGRPILDHVLAAVRAAGVLDVGVIVGTGAAADQIRRHVGDGSGLGLRAVCLTQERPLGLAHAVRTARPFLGGDDFLVYLGDNLLAEGISEAAARFRRERPAGHLLVQKVADPRAFGVAELDATGRVRRVAEKPAEPVSDLALTGVSFFTPALHAAIAAIRPSTRGELELTDAAQWLVGRGARVTAEEYGGYWKDIGSVPDVLAANRRVLDGVVVAPTARIIGGRIEGPAVIGPGAVVENCHLGPYVAIGAGCHVRDSRISDSVLFDDVRVLSVPELTGSVLGRAAVVRGHGPGPIRLVVGDDSMVDLTA
ncbi:glucose-1-phosphate thymidylyltransferase [Actinoplanes sp. LDG1-06]|uniref:Glucose-1-phosphate thymidylyltransferase n=1 Tax=Paractinoplanes ovalisporus TaxID=2810368 RepID=A0ABS2AJR8_9ACTN|nr:glucose-1-phosphate thymidylyltransferase [Actinoplanes ovalisporus]MBM2620100.1 glucose-1-phosphate thymidylyltransferase [Actinoplanes ovalisporus]